MFLLGIVFALEFLSLSQANCSFEEYIIDEYVSYSYSCYELTVTLSFTNGTKVGNLNFNPANYDECAVISIDNLPKIDVKGVDPFDYLELSISNTELDQKKSYSDIILKLGIDPSIIRTISVYGCPNFSMTQLKGFDNLWNLEISSSLNSDSLTNNMDIGKLFPKLRTLRLDSNQLNRTSNFAGLKMLEEAVFSFNGIEYLPDDLFCDSSMLTAIDISEPELEKFPASICKGHEYLESLNLAIGRATFPKFSHCTEVRQIYVNKIKLNDSFELHSKGLFPEMTELLSVTLMNVGLSKLTTDTFGKNTHLSSLTLSFNGIEEIEDNAFLNLAKLTDVDVSFNNISKLTDKMLPSSIETVFASENSIKEFAIGISLPKLKFMDLSRSKLSDTFEFKNVPKMYPSLQYLNLQGNQLNYFNISGTFDFIHDNDVEINLSGNQIKTVRVTNLASTDRGFSRIKLDLNNNPLICDCALKLFLEVIREKNGKIKLVKDTLCELPKGETLKTINLNKLNC